MMPDLVPPTIQDVFKARATIRRYIPPTPLIKPWALCDHLGAEVYVKCENMQPIGAFKVRGGIYLMSTLSQEERSKGVVTASTGNHGQSVAYSARLFGVHAVIYAPIGANPFKVASMRSLGAEVRLEGRDYEESREASEEAARREGFRYIHAVNEPKLFAGVGTIGLEILEEVPDIDFIIVPIGGGSGCSGTGIVAKALRPEAKVIGVQAEQAPAVYRSWQTKKITSTGPVNTFADGLATRQTYQFALDVLSRVVDDMVLVSEEEMERGILTLAETAHLVAEGAGAASTAAAFKIKDRIQGKKVALVLSGGNLTIDKLKEIARKY
ncbi:MAG: threonine/serine dehydratase [Bacillota bacterium]|nr:threonine/serine dehydratase [Bacillota bacterium]